MSIASSTRKGSRPSALIAALAASVCLSAVVPAPASASDAGAVAAGIVGGAALGALAVGALGSAPPPVRVYREPLPAPVYYERLPPRRIYVEPACVWERQRVWTGYRWVHERVRVCE